MKGLTIIIILMFSSFSYSFVDICAEADSDQWNDCFIFVRLPIDDDTKDDLYIGEFKDGYLGKTGTLINFDEKGRIDLKRFLWQEEA